VPKLSATRTYADEQSPVQSDFDAFIDDIEILVNTIKLDDDNFQDGGITASDKLVDESIQANQIRNNNITTSKIADSAVTTEKIQDDAVTTAKIANGAVDEDVTSILAGYMPPGAVEMFHTFNSTVSVPRGWMICNGDEVNETNYEALHGAGTYTTDVVSTSPLLNKFLPDMADRYAVGALDTTQDAADAWSRVNGDYFGNENHTIDISHTHTSTHNHSTTLGQSDEILCDTRGGTLPIWFSLDSILDYDSETLTTGSGGSTTLDVQPESVEFLFIVKVV